MIFLRKSNSMAQPTIPFKVEELVVVMGGVSIEPADKMAVKQNFHQISRCF